jgi:hypothetical protein
MLYRMVRPVNRKGTRHYQFVRRIPIDLRAHAAGVRLDLPIGDKTVPLTISAKASSIRVSLRTAERIMPIGPDAEARLSNRTITNLYNARPTWLQNAHKDLAKPFTQPMVGKAILATRTFSLGSLNSTRHARKNKNLGARSRT